MNALITEIVDKHGTPASFAQASTFVHQGIQMPFMYYLVSGKVKIEQSVVNGKSLLFSFTCAGSWLGDLELFSDTELANSTVTAVSDVETMRFPIELMRQNLKVYPGLSELFARSLASAAPLADHAPARFQPLQRPVGVAQRERLLPVVVVAAHVHGEVR